MTETIRGIRSRESLLEKARSLPALSRNRKVTDEEIELAIAWLEGTVTLTQASHALGHKQAGPTYAKMATILHEAFTRGIIQVTPK